MGYFVITRNRKLLFRMYATQEKDSSTLVLGQPREISSLIASFLSANDLARAQRVCKAWYEFFGRESLWFPLLPPFPTLSHRHPKVNVAYQTLICKDWLNGDLTSRSFVKDDPHRCRVEVVLNSPDSLSWIMTIDRKGQIILWEGVGTKNVSVKQIENPHIREVIYGGMVSPDGRSAFTFGVELVRWRGFENDKIFPKVIRSGRRRREPIRRARGRGGGLTVSTITDDPNYRVVCDRILCAAISKDGTWALSFEDHGRVVQWIGMDEEFPLSTPIAGEGTNVPPVDNVRSVCIAPDGTWALATGSMTTYWRGFQTGNISMTILKRDDYGGSPGMSCVVSLDGSWALSIGMRGIIKWSEFQNETPRETLLSTSSSPLRSEAVTAIRLSPDGRCAVTASITNTFVHWSNLDSESPSRRKLAEHLFPQKSVQKNIGFCRTQITFTQT